MMKFRAEHYVCELDCIVPVTISGTNEKNWGVA
jgi:hypothetical protein